MIIFVCEKVRKFAEGYTLPIMGEGSRLNPLNFDQPDP